MFKAKSIALLVCLCAFTAQAQWTARMSVDSSGNQSNDQSWTNFMGGGTSNGGKRVVFFSAASNLVPNDTNGRYDVFLRDRLYQTTYRVSVDSFGNEGNHMSKMPVINADGRFVAFESYADNLVANDLNGTGDVFLHDTWTGRTDLVSRAFGVPRGTSGNALARHPSISANGRFVAFQSHASNLVPNDTNGHEDVFVFDSHTGMMRLVSVDSQGMQGAAISELPSISGDGRFVAFVSWAMNLVPNDNNGICDIFVHDLQFGTTRRVSVDSWGGEANGASLYPNISEDGQFVAFDSAADNLVAGDTNGVFDVFVHDLLTGTTELVSRDTNGQPGNDQSYGGRLSRHGRYVTFSSQADNLVPKDSNSGTDVFVFDRWTNSLDRVSVSTGGGQSDGGYTSSIDASGRFITFLSWAGNLVAGDTNLLSDVFLHERSRRFETDGPMD